MNSAIAGSTSPSTGITNIFLGEGGAVCMDAGVRVSFPKAKETEIAMAKSKRRGKFIFIREY
jgi:hypothetical protein